ncbi:YidB family protein [Citrifermentans bremense]|uniref:YidB family protein n=1 Tax=Citrifermentans bremense TaxID=60035 RepID=UPI000402CEF7
MGIIDDVTSKVRGMSGGENSGLVKGIVEMLSNRETGGLGGIIQSFQQKGLGDIISSWIGKGPNAPISPNQVKEGLGNERMQQLSTQAGTSTDETANKLSNILPEMVDKATPEGTVPEGGILDKGLEFIKSRFS